MESSIMDLISEYALKIVIAVAIFYVGKWIVRKITDLVTKITRKTGKVDETLLKFLSNIIYYALMIVVILTALQQLGVNTTSFLAILGAAGLAIGLALKDSLSNFASGVMIILFRPFKIGDFINAGGVSGTVEEISIFNTILKTGDNQSLIVPNGSITSGTITNVNAKPTRRVDLLIGISYDDDIKKAKDILNDVVKSNDKVLVDEGVTVAVSELADSSVNFVVRAWVNTPDYWDVRFALIENIKITFDKEGITIPYPQQDVHHYNKD